MKAINTYIAEKFQVSKDYKRQYAYTPKNKKELIDCIKEKIKQEGLGTPINPLNLNDIDTSKITDMSNLFDRLEGNLMLKKLSEKGYFDISDWDVSNVENMGQMFYASSFNGDISDWDVSNVDDMHNMFYLCDNFNSDLSKWDVSKVKNMAYMFQHCENFNSDLSDWDVSNVKSMDLMFYDSPLQNNPPKWYKV